MTDIFKGVLTIAFVFAVAVPVLLYYGWAGSVLWGWFVVPKFGLSTLSMWEMTGVLLVIRALWPSSPYQKRTSEEELTGWGLMILGPLLLLAVGQVIR